MNIIPPFIQQRNLQKKLQLIEPLLQKNKSVLDFGCGDLALAIELKRRNPSLSVTGVDVIDVKKKPRDIKFICYDGEKLPFKDKSFDNVLCFYVLHHCLDIKTSLMECKRVAKERIILVESLPRHPIEIPFMGLVDWLYNVWKLEPIPLTFQFLCLKEWKKLFLTLKVYVKSQKVVKIMAQPSFMPFGRSYLFELYR